MWISIFGKEKGVGTLMMYRYVNTALESMSIVICVILLIYQMFERKSKSRSSYWFNAMIVFNIGMLCGDITDWMMGGVPGKLSYYFQFTVAIVLYFTFSGLLLFSLYGWIISSIKQKAKISPMWLSVGVLLSGLQCILAVTIPITKISYIDANNYYARGNLFWLTQICPYTLYAFAAYLLIRYRKAFKRRELIYLCVFITIPLFAEFIQLVTYKYSTLNVAISLALIVIFAFIQSEREFEKEQELRVSVVDENRRLEEMQSFQENLSGQLIEVLCSTVEAKDNYTQGHSLRVAQYAREIMYRLGGDEKAQQEVYYIGILHDVGKIHVKDEIINKNGRLTPEEYEEIKLHTVAGYQILRSIDVIPGLAVGARWHHERYDGTGYPNGLAGENIPLVARIISVADAYDAMTSNRSYHRAMAQNVVREEIVNGMGTQFDPKIAQIMLDMIDEDMQYEMKQVHFNKAIYVLLIDDDPAAHEMVEQALIDENFILTSAYNAKEGIEYLKDMKYDVCLLDMEMPDMHGMEVLRWIHENIPKLRTVILTGDKSIETIVKAETLGARDYITKPVRTNILTESIKGVLMN